MVVWTLIVISTRAVVSGSLTYDSQQKQYLTSQDPYYS